MRLREHCRSTCMWDTPGNEELAVGFRLQSGGRNEGPILAVAKVILSLTGRLPLRPGWGARLDRTSCEPAPSLLLLALLAASMVEWHEVKPRPPLFMSDLAFVCSSMPLLMLLSSLMPDGSMRRRSRC